MILKCSLLDFCLIIINFVLNTITSILINLLLLAGGVIEKIINVIMTETGGKTSKKRKRSLPTVSNQTVANRGLINANWQSFLSSNLIMDKKTEKPNEDDQKQHFTGTFRNKRKNKKKDNFSVSNTVQNNFKTLNINTEPVNSNTNNKSLIEASDIIEKKVNNNNDKKNKLTKFIAIDCEMVGIGSDGNDHMLARVSLVNKFGDCIYDKFVKAQEEVINYRTDISGIRKEDMMNGEDFTVVQKEVRERVLVHFFFIGFMLTKRVSNAHVILRPSHRKTGGF